MIAAVVLAAGAGERMGGGGKALLELEGRSFLDRVVSTCFEGGCDAVWVVVREGDEMTERAAATLNTSLVSNPRPEQGMFSSVRIGIQAALDAKAEGLLIFPVDHPRVESETVRTLITRLATAGDSTFLQPTTDDRGGHPIALNATSARNLLELSPETVLREALTLAGLSPSRIPVPDKHVRENLNLPSDLPEHP